MFPTVLIGKLVLPEEFLVIYNLVYPQQQLIAPKEV